MIRLHESMIRLRESMIRLRESMIRLRESMIRLHESMIRLHESMIRLHESMIRLHESMIRLHACASTGRTGELGPCYSSRAFSPSAFQLGEKVAKPDEGALVLAKQWTIFMNGRGKPMKTRNFSARAAPSSAFGTFSPRKKPRGEKDSRLRESQVIQTGSEKCRRLTHQSTAPSLLRRQVAVHLPPRVDVVLRGGDHVAGFLGVVLQERGEKDSRLRESQVIQTGSEKCRRLTH